MRSIVFSASSFKDFSEWAILDKRVQQKISTLIFDEVRDPFSGLGKLEPLKYDLKGCWSRRITDEHRLFSRAQKLRFKLFPANTITKP